MNRFRSLSIVALGAIATPAAADLTAQQLFDDWQTNAALLGATLEADVASTGSGLQVSNMTFVQEISGDGVGPDMTSRTMMGPIELVENGDGSVSIVLASPFPISFDLEGDPDLAAMSSGGVLASFSGLSVTAAGDPENITYTYIADSISVVPGEMPEMPPGASFDMEIAMRDVAATYVLTGTGLDRITDTDGSFSAMTVSFDGGDGSESGKMTLALGATTLAAEGTMMSWRNYVQSMTLQNPGQANVTPGGVDITGSMTYDSAAFDLQVEGPSPVTISSSNGGGAANVAFGATGISYDISARNAEIAIASSDIPVPVELSAATTGLVFTMPTAPQPEPSDIAIGLGYTDLVVNEAVWSMVDPSQTLPRDPATVQLDLTGTVQLFVNLMAMDPTTMRGPPGEMRSLSLNELLIRAVGAELTGQGAVTFEPGRFPPSPVGRVDLGLSGLQGLLDNLTQAGLLPLEQAGMVSAMTGMFARPGAGPDTLESTIEFTPGGGITANGIPLQ
ncbi:MAG: DUF2125 domain-containing protein [Pseudomonadota bacterium]